ncbi:MAG: FAD-dependent oxidoreductase, partial [Candidatus Methanospirareceae archaeon]
MRIGVYICHCGINIAATVNVEEVTEFASKLPNVVIARHYMYMCSEPGQELIKKDIVEHKLDRVVVAACSPRMHEPTYRKACEEAGLNQYYFEMANIREQCSWVHLDEKKATEKAKDLVASAVAKASLLEALEEKEVEVTPAALVIGGGIAGIYAALSIADAGYKVYLVEKEPSIGGHVAKLSRTFPTLERSSCLIAPVMVEVARHENIELLTHAEVEEVEGYIGNFKARIKKKPRYVDEEKCTACGKCAEACVLKEKIPNEVDFGMSKRAAIYIPYPYAVPAVYTVDDNNCLMIKEGRSGNGDKPPCVEVCEEEAIDFKQKEEDKERKIGTIIVATGYDTFDARLKPEFGYELYDNVITSLEFER